MRLVAALLLCGVLVACATAPKTAPPPPDSYLIVFKGKATAILPKAAVVINRVTARANAHPEELVQLAGPSIKAVPHYNPRLAAERMLEVQHALEAAGLDKKRIVRTPLLGANLKPDGTGSQQIEIRLVVKPTT